MSKSALEGLRGYSEQADNLIQKFEALSFDEAHQGVTDLISPAPLKVLDIGAGSGRDAAWFAARGDDVTAIEPTAELREAGKALHPSPRITWIDDTLPELASVAGRKFDLVWLSAVWMHFTSDERAAMMPTLAALLSPHGAMLISLRHGPIPDGRRMFEVTPDETIRHATASGLRSARNVTVDSSVLPDVRWSRLWFVRDENES